MVMTQRDKIGMEALFRRVLPPHKRLGSQFVFRQAQTPTPCTTLGPGLANIPFRRCAARHIKCLVKHSSPGGAAQ